MADIFSIIAKQRKAAEKSDAIALDQIVAVYGKSYRRIELELEVSLRRLAGKETLQSRMQIAKELKKFKATTEEELQSFSKWLETSMSAFTSGAMIQGGAHSYELMKYLSGIKKLNNIEFSRLSVDATNQMLKFLEEGAPLYERIQAISPFYADKITEQLIKGIALGLGPRQTAKEIEPFIMGVLKDAKNIFASPLADALRMTRTAQLWSYREASRNNYLANSDLITGWQWSTSLDADVCGACLSLEGKVFQLDEIMDGHYNCRCAIIPVILGQPAIDENRGQDWFDSQDEATQRSILGPGKYDAYTAGLFEFGQLSTQKPDAVYGTMRVETPLKDLVSN